MENKFDLLGAIIAYENGELTDGAVVGLFSHLIKTGRAWELQGHYGQTAASFIKADVIDEFGEILIDIPKE